MAKRRPWTTTLGLGLTAYSLYAINVLTRSVVRLFGLFSPPKVAPDIVKTYSCRPGLPIRFVVVPSLLTLNECHMCHTHNTSQAKHC